MKRLAAVMIFALSCWAQSPQGTPAPVDVASGTLTGEDGTPIVGAYVVFQLLPPFPSGRLAQTEWTAVSDEAGLFTASGLIDGSYQLCIQATQGTWLNPCEWGRQPPTLTISSGQPTAALGVVLKKGAIVPVQVDDPGQFLSLHEGATPGAHLLLGVGNDAFSFRLATPMSASATGRNYQIIIPFDVPEKLVVFSSFFKLSDATGLALPGAATAITINVPSGQTPTKVHLAITGGGFQ